MSENLPVRRVAATLTISSFSLAALMGILALLGAGQFGEGEVRVLLTTLIVGCASICMLCYLTTGGTTWQPVGVLGSLVLVLPVVSGLILVWGDWNGDSEGLVKAFGIGVVLAASIAQGSLLLALAGEREKLAAVLWPTCALIAVLAVIICGLIVGGVDGDGIWRLLGIIAILDVLGTLVTIAVAKFGDRDDVRASSYDRRISVQLPADQSIEIANLSRTSGRPVEHLVAEAVDRLLHA